MKIPAYLLSLNSSAMWAEKLGKQLGNPTRSVAGWLVSKLLTVRNKVLEENAVQLCGIRPGDTVLELGHGPGLGLLSAAELLTEPTGHLIGVDYSEYMHQVKLKYLLSGIKYSNPFFNDTCWCLFPIVTIKKCLNNKNPHSRGMFFCENLCKPS